ncbi:hypothetical protein E4T56_gene9819 [Termitomyces sp. T112]|nr:hypothetical protein E4T56_gene9819 [Termitomyces sp. T112]
MLDKLLPRWLQPWYTDNQEQDKRQSQGIAINTTTNTEGSLPFPVGTQKTRSDYKSSYSKMKTKWKGDDLKHVSGACISYPIRSTSVSLTGLDAPDPPPEPTPAPYLDSYPTPDSGSDSASGSGNGSGRWHNPHPYPYSPPPPYNTSHSHQHPHLHQSHTPTRSGPSNVEWVVGQDEGAVGLPPPAVVRLNSDSQRMGRSASAPILSTPMPTPVPSSVSVSAPRGMLRLNTNTTHSNTVPTVTHTKPFTPVQNTYTFQTGFGTGGVSTDVYNHAYNYPLAKQLSPILELDYFTPVSMHTATSGSAGSLGSLGYGFGHGRPQRESIEYAMSMRSARSASGSSTGPGNGIGGGASEIARPSVSHPFITRQVNRTISQSSSHTQGSTTSSLPRPSPSSTAPPQKLTTASTGAEPSMPSFPAPLFPGSHLHSHPSRDWRRSYVSMPMPTIPGSSESAPADTQERDGYEASEVYGGEEDNESLHAESFVTATGEAIRVRVRESRAEDNERVIEEEMEDVELDIADAEASYQASIDGESTHSLNPNRDHNQSTTSLHALPNPVPGSAANTDNFNFNSNSNSHSTSSSFVPLRWDLDAPLGTNVVIFSFRPKTASTWTWLADRTPAFWAFCLGFVFPVLWFVGGWHFTKIGECPPKVGMWEFYFFGNSGWVWRRVYMWIGGGCCVRRRKRRGDRESGDVEQGRVGKERGKGKGKEKGLETGDGQKEGQVQGRGLRVPRWVTEKQSSDLGRLRLQDPKRSLRGISFGYPFVPRPLSARRRTSVSAALAQSTRWRRSGDDRRAGGGCLILGFRGVGMRFVMRFLDFASDFVLHLLF